MQRLLLTLSLLAVWQPALAGPETSQDGVSAALEQHFTGNAFDAPLALPDWFTLVRGAWQETWQGEGLSVKFRADADATRHRLYGIEDDRSAGAVIEATGKLGGMELRGTLGYRAASLGDDIQIDNFIIGTRTLKQVMAANVDAGVQLDPLTSLILSVSNAYELYGKAHFEDDIAEPTQLDPDTNRFRLQSILSRKTGFGTFGALAATDIVTVQQLGDPPIGLSLALFTLQANGVFTSPGGTTLKLAGGFQSIFGQDDIFQQTRPTFRIEIRRMFGEVVELRGSMSGAYEIVDSDDPLASWLQRGEFEIGWRPRERLKFGAGLFQEQKFNLLYENEEKAYGGYIEMAYDWTKALTLVCRADFENRFATVVDTDTRNLDIYVGVKTRL